MKKITIGIVQMQVTEDKDKNLYKAQTMISRVVNKGAELVVLPEMFNCPYQNDLFPEYAEKSEGKTWGFLSDTAAKNNIFLVGGSIPELDSQGRIFNTCYVFNKKGEQVGKHRKMHLFDIDVEGGQSFKESDVLSAGRQLTLFETNFGKIGVMICYDIRFPELSRMMVERGAKCIIVPAAFNMTTGPAHWELLFRSRALDNQVYTVGAAPARNPDSSYVSYGNSLVVDPWGHIIDRRDDKEGILINEIDIDSIEKIREELPLLKHKRNDIYKINLK